MANVYQDESAEQSAEIGRAVAKFNQCKSQNRASDRILLGQVAFSLILLLENSYLDALSEFNLCAPYPNTTTRWKILYSKLLEAYYGPGRSNEPYTIGGNIPRKLQYLINQTSVVKSSSYLG